MLLERDALASGSTSKAAGGIRAQFADELNIRIALRSLREFEELGDAISFRQHGYLFLLDNEVDLTAFRDAVELQRSLSVPSRVLTPDEAREIVPQLEIDDLLAATCCERDGYATPEALVQHYATASGATCGKVAPRPASSCATAASRRSRRRAADRDRHGRLLRRRLVAGGRCARRRRAAGGRDARSMWFTPQDGGLPERLPLTIDFSSGFYFHREGPGLAFGGRERSLEDVAEAAARRLPVLAELPVQARGGAGTT